MEAFNITVIHKSAPMIVAKAQEELRERMDPGFWSPAWQKTLAPLLQAPRLQLIIGLWTKLALRAWNI